MGLLHSFGERLARTRFTAAERRRAEAIFAALLPGETAGLVPFASIDRTEFWRCIEEAPGPSFGPGLRAMIHGFALLPLADARFRRTFDALSVDEREAFVASLAGDTRYAVRQMLTTLKMVACFAYFEDESVRARYAARSEETR